MYRYFLISLLLIFTFSCAHEKKGIILYDVNLYNGRIDFAIFYKDSTVKINGIEYLFKGNTPVYFGPLANISSAYLAHDQIIEINGNSFPLKAIMTNNGIGSYNIAFHENGMPRLFWLSENIVIPVGSTSYSFRGVQSYIYITLEGPLQGNVPLETIELYDNGNLYAGYTNKVINYKSISIPEGTKVIFTRDGELEKYYDIEQDNYIIVSNLEGNSMVTVAKFEEMR